MTEHRPYQEHELELIRELHLADYSRQGIAKVLAEKAAKDPTLWVARPHGSINNQIHAMKLPPRASAPKRRTKEEIQLAVRSAQAEVLPTRSDVVVRKVVIEQFWRKRIVRITLPRISCLEQPIAV